MFLSALFATFFGAPLVFSQVVYDKNHNTTSLGGTWSTTSDGHVLVGPTFANPMNSTFSVPAEYRNVPSRTYPFTEDGFWEQCTYMPTKISSDIGNCTADGATLIYQHGTYQLNSDGSMTLTPFEQDGRYQQWDPCGAFYNKTVPFKFTEHIASWNIVMNPILGPILQLSRPHVPVQNLTQAYNPPYMLATRPLTTNSATKL